MGLDLPGFQSRFGLSGDHPASGSPPRVTSLEPVALPPPGNTGQLTLVGTGVEHQKILLESLLLYYKSF